MNTVKFVLAQCPARDRKFCMELKLLGGKWQVVNFLNITDAEAAAIPFEQAPGGLTTAASLVACYHCGSRQVGRCSCAQQRSRCQRKGAYDFQCIYCSRLELPKPKGAEPSILVTAPSFDNIAQVLDSMGLKYRPFAGSYDADLLFINCGTGDTVDPQKLRAFVGSGGCVYISDLASSILTAAFPGVLTFRNGGSKCKLTADVVDQELRQIAGKDVPVEFDLGSWSIIEGHTGLWRNQGRVLLQAARGNDYTGRPLMVSFRYGQGTVFYTSFHNHRQASQKEQMLLQLLLLKQLGARTNQTVEQVGQLVGLNIQLMKNKFQNGTV